MKEENKKSVLYLIPESEYDVLKSKADKWDKLGKDIEACYGKENEEGEWIENEDDDTDLLTIGELAATAYGWL